MYPSEYLFWSVLPDDYNLPTFLATLTAYTLTGRVLVCILQFCRVDSLSGLFLAGAIYGWTVEGVVVATMYDDFPINLIWTGVAWHGLFSVMLVWLYVRKAALWSWPRYAAALVAVGVLFGIWSAFWPNEKPGFPTAWGVLADGLIASGGFILAQVIYDRAPAGSFKVTRTEAGFLGLLVLVMFGLQATARPSPVLAFYPILAGAALALLMFGRGKGPMILDIVVQSRASLGRRAALLTIPVMVAASFAATRWAVPGFPTNQAFYLGTIAAGTVFLATAVAMNLISKIRRGP